jgi:long-chain acyl-CoA synthetase
VCLTHHAFISAARGGADFDHLTADEDILSYLPMAWVGDHLFSFAQAMVTGFTINCPESAETVMTDLREIGPTYYFAPPRVFENLLTQVMIRMEDASVVKQKMFHFFMAVARRSGAEILDGSRCRSAIALLYALGNSSFSAAEERARHEPHPRRLYRRRGDRSRPVPLLSLDRHQSEAALRPDRNLRLRLSAARWQIKFDSVGKPAPGVEVKIADNGEILVKGPMLLKEYYKRPDATAEAINADGYFMTGDAGLFDDDGHLKIIDRAKDVGKLANGAMYAPNYIENKLKFFPYIKEAVVFGDRREMVCAFINIDIGAVGNWAERRGIAYSGYTDLAAKPEVYGLIQECVEQVNGELVGEGALADSQIHRFLILHKELDPDDDELTRTRKVRRGFVAEKYAVLIDALYGGKE